MHRFDVVGLRSLLVFVLASSTVATTACDGGCPEGTTLKKGVCAQLPQGNGDGAATGDPAATGSEGPSATNGNQAAASGGPAKTMAAAGNRAAATMTSVAAVGAAGNSGGTSTPTQAGAGVAASGPSAAQAPTAAGSSAMPAATAGAAMMSLPTAGMDASNSTPEAGASSTACMPSPETCDGTDNDCDSKVDEEIAPKPCGLSKGICKPGMIECHNGKWDDENTQCQGAVGPSPMGEECDAGRQDENCDGVANEGCACVEGQTMPCSSGRYTCKEGTVSCVDGKFSTQCMGEVKGSAEVCDGKDNDCNGPADDGGDALCSGGRHCIGAGGCVECTDQSQCRAATCRTPTCNSGKCGDTPAAAGSSCNASGGSMCDGKGNCVSCIDNGDCRSAGKTDACNEYRCESGQCKRQVNQGATCDGTGTCDSQGTCAKPTRSEAYGPCTKLAQFSDECAPNHACTNLRNVKPGCMPICSGNMTACTVLNRPGICLVGYCVLTCPNEGGSGCPSPAQCTDLDGPTGPGTQNVCQ